MIIEAARKKLPGYGCCLLSALAFGLVHYYNSSIFCLRFLQGCFLLTCIYRGVDQERLFFDPGYSHVA
jgi:membrane protease YdiL (CAAX protease family)